MKPKRLAKEGQLKAQKYKKEAEQLQQGIQDSVMEKQKLLRERLREMREKSPNNIIFPNSRKPGSLKSFIEKHLAEDGFFKEGETKYTFELTNDKLSINGKEQSNAMHKKYLKLYRKHTNMDSADYDFSVQFNGK